MTQVKAYRLYKTKHADTAMTGYGAKRYGGRWNPQGMSVVYCSSTLSLAQLETLVHLNGPLPPDGFESLELSFPKSCIGKSVSLDELTQLPFDWRSYPSHVTLQEIGSEWVNSAASLVMEVPSAVSPSESNYVLNPKHPDVDRISTHSPVPLEWDSRLTDKLS